jgi:hypothetical protein
MGSEAIPVGTTVYLQLGSFCVRLFIKLQQSLAGANGFLKIKMHFYVIASDKFACTNKTTVSIKIVPYG